MATPAAKLIFDDLVTALEGITVANGYKTNVLSVLFHSEMPEDATARPTIGVHRMPVQYSYDYPGVLRCTAPVTLFGHVDGATEAARFAAIENLLDDMIAAVHADPTRGGNAIDTIVTQSDDDTGEGGLRYSQGLGASVALQLQVRWDRVTSSS